MLKLALNVWITHGSSHRGLAAIAKGPGRVHVWMFPSISTHSFTHARMHTHIKCPHRDLNPVSPKYHLQSVEVTQKMGDMLRLNSVNSPSTFHSHRETFPESGGLGFGWRGEDGREYASRRTDGARKEEEKRRVMREVSAPSLR